MMRLYIAVVVSMLVVVTFANEEGSCPDNNKLCGSLCYAQDVKCCSGNHACKMGFQCCGAGCMPDSNICCNNGAYTCTAGQKCCSDGCIPDTQECCGKHACAAGKICCGGGCISADMVCCGTYACPANATCDQEKNACVAA